jgi:hypothetical protein
MPGFIGRGAQEKGKAALCTHMQKGILAFQSTILSCFVNPWPTGRGHTLARVEAASRTGFDAKLSVTMPCFQNLQVPIGHSAEQ